MLKKISINNFRTFGQNGQPAEFEFAPITILTGPNNSGKSSLIKLLYLLHKSNTKPNSKLLNLDFSEVNNYLPNMEQIKNKKLNVNEIRIEIEANSWLSSNEFSHLKVIFKEDIEEFSKNPFRKNTCLIEKYELFSNNECVYSVDFFYENGEEKFRYNLDSYLIKKFNLLNFPYYFEPDKNKMNLMVDYNFTENDTTVQMLNEHKAVDISKYI